MSRKIRVGIVGGKFAADFHCDAFSRHEHAEIIAIASPSGPAAVAKKWAIPAMYTDYRQMLKRNDLDVVSVCTPNYTHHRVALDAAAAGKHVIVEKPLATRIEDAEEMIDACRREGVLLMYAEDWCFCPALKKAEALVQEGGIGRVLYVKAKECHNGTHSPYARDLEMCGGGSFLHLGIHPVGWLLYFLGRANNPVIEATGRMTGGLKGNFVHQENGGEDFGLGVLRFKDGQIALVEGNYITVGGMDDRVEIYGSDGILEIDLTFGSPITCYSRPGISYSIEKTDHNFGWTRPAVDEFLSLGYVPELEFFIDCVRGKKGLFYGVDGPAGLAALKIVMACYRSHREERTIRGEWV